MAHINLTSVKKNNGFTLAELATVMVIIGLLLGGLLSSLPSQINSQRIKATTEQLNEIKQALIGFAIANGRLPCPATAASLGVESPVGGGDCTNPFDGFVPAKTLGIANVDAAGLVVDSWGGTSGRIRYAVTRANSCAFTTLNGLHAIASGAVFTSPSAACGPNSPGLQNLSSLSPNLNVCASATGITPTTCGAAAANRLTNQAVAVIYSVGPNGATGGTGIDESANPNPNGGSADAVFVYHTPTETGAPNGAFDDIVTWISWPTLVNGMVNAGQLP
jgi:prepilin-type N-terminal cleavage/methylation domain-containing protein